MIRNLTRAAAGVLAVSLTFTGVSVTVSAAENSGSVLSGGGVGLVLALGNKLENITNDSSLPIEPVVERIDIEETETEAVDEVTEEDLFRNLVIAQVNHYVNVRSIPSEEGEIIGKLYDNSVGTFISEEDGWYQINSGSVTGYVKGEYCVTGDEAVEIAKEVGKRFATVTTQTLFVRTEPSIESSRLGMVPEADDLLVLDETDEWVQVDIEEGTGWVSKEYVTLHTEFVQAESKAEEEARLAKEEEERKRARAAAAAATSSQSSSTNTTNNSTPAQYTVSGDSEMGVAVAEYALQFVGNPYVYGGSSLTNGTDCSGFVMSVYANFGVSLPHSSASDRSQGYAVDGLDNAQPGDLICYSGHVALYIGNGQIVHASDKNRGIIVSSASYRQILAVRRIF